MNTKKIIPSVVLSIFLLGAGCSFTQTVKVSTNSQGDSNVNAANAKANQAQGVRYAGEDGKNALELLQAEHQVDVSDQGFVNAIDSRPPGDREYWAFYVNGKLADVGAKEYQTKSRDTIEWKLEKF
ncbi:MAG: DUF4430 domain-containing protein [Candidatus Kerfeldbacteria bacterium]|nr:DUF4430 domain-containing protein [Candidatus Kerfeldbacteria bacterium]